MAAVISSGVKRTVNVDVSLEICLLSFDKLCPTPSSVDGLEIDDETDLRILGCELIQTAGVLLKLPQVAMATAQVLFHRFYYSQSFIKYDYEAVAMGCSFLASKIEESPRSLTDVINVFNHIRQVRNQLLIEPTRDKGYGNLKDRVKRAEMRVLKELGFCVHVKLPYNIIVRYLVALECKSNCRLVQKAWNYMNDGLRTNIFVRYSPETIACACIFLSARELKVPLPNRPHWFEVFGAVEKDIKDVCLTILRLYMRKKPDQQKLEKIVKDLRKKREETKLRAKGIQPSEVASKSGSSISNSSVQNISSPDEEGSCSKSFVKNDSPSVVKNKRKSEPSNDVSKRTQRSSYDRSNDRCRRRRSSSSSNSRNRHSSESPESRSSYKKPRHTSSHSKSSSRTDRQKHKKKKKHSSRHHKSQKSRRRSSHKSRKEKTNKSRSRDKNTTTRPRSSHRNSSAGAAEADITQAGIIKIQE